MQHCGCQRAHAIYLAWGNFPTMAAPSVPLHDAADALPCCAMLRQALLVAPASVQSLDRTVVFWCCDRHYAAEKTQLLSKHHVLEGHLGREGMRPSS